jgi:DnaJ family protein B protein 4
MKPSPIYITIVLTLQQAYLGVSYPVEIERWVGTQTNIEKEVVYVTIPAGIDEKEMIELSEKGNIVNNSIRGDVKISIEIKNDTDFHRSGLDLHYCKKITLKEALCGFSFEMQHINGKRICFNNTVNTTIIQPNHKKVVNNMGMIRGDVRGNLIIEFEVEFPKELSEEKMKAMSDILE